MSILKLFIDHVNRVVTFTANGKKYELTFKELGINNANIVDVAKITDSIHKLLKG